MPEIPPEIRAQIAAMSDTEYSAFVAQVRAPDGAEALRTAAGQLLTGDALESFVRYADPSKFVGEGGQVDAAKVQTNIRAMYGMAAPPPRNQGQSSGGKIPSSRPGDSARIALNKRFGIPIDSEAAAMQGAPANFPGSRGSSAREALARRFPQAQKDT